MGYSCDVALTDTASPIATKALFTCSEVQWTRLFFCSSTTVYKNNNKRNKSHLIINPHSHTLKHPTYQYSSGIYTGKRPIRVFLEETDGPNLESAGFLPPFLYRYCVTEHFWSIFMLRDVKFYDLYKCVSNIQILLVNNNEVGIATGYGLDGRKRGARVPVGAGFFSSPRCPHRLWGPPSLLSNGYRGDLSPEVKRSGREADHSPPINGEAKNTWIYTSTPHTSSWRSA
jgi:hypothetical protein